MTLFRLDHPKSVGGKEKKQAGGVRGRKTIVGGSLGYSWGNPSAPELTAQFKFQDAWLEREGNTRSQGQKPTEPRGLISKAEFHQGLGDTLESHLISRGPDTQEQLGPFHQGREMWTHPLAPHACLLSYPLKSQSSRSIVKGRLS